MKILNGIISEIQLFWSFLCLVSNLLKFSGHAYLHKPACNSLRTHPWTYLKMELRSLESQSRKMASLGRNIQVSNESILLRNPLNMELSPLFRLSIQPTAFSSRRLVNLLPSLTNR